MDMESSGLLIDQIINMSDQGTNTSSLLVPDGFGCRESDEESEVDSLHIGSAQDITFPFTTHLPDFLPNLDDTVTVEVDLDGCNSIELNQDAIDSVNNTEGKDVANNTNCSNLPPVTPTKPQDAPAVIDPITPTANLKLLMSAVSPEIRSMEKRQKSKALFNAIVQAASQESLELQQTEQNMEIEVEVDTNSQGEECAEDMEKPANRKAKSLGLLCQRFLSKYPDYPADGQAMEISLDAISKELCVERRRIYDIVNVLESVEMVQRQAKNKYLWHGKTYLLRTLVRLKCLGERNDYGNQMEQLKKLQIERDYQQEISNGGGRSKKQPLKDFTNTAGQMKGTKFLEDDPNARKDKSLGVMSQKFIMLFLVSKNQLVTLDIAARVLIGDINYEIVENSKFKTKVRRLYDIANILTSLGMIKKVHIHERRGRKPAFRWIGPNPDVSDIDLSQYDLHSKPVFRHSHFPPPVATSTCASSTTNPVPFKRTRNRKTSIFTRHSSFNFMKKPKVPGSDDNRHCSSAPSSPVKREEEMTISHETNEKFQQEFDHLRTKYPDCMSKLFAACNIEKERMQQQEEEQEKQLTIKTEDSDQFEVSDHLQTARKVLNMDETESTEKSQSAESEQHALNNLLTETVDSLHCALREGDTMRRSKRTIKQPLSDEYEYQPVVKRSKMEHQAASALQKCNEPSGQRTHIMLQRVKTENLTMRVMSELTNRNQMDPQSAQELPPDLAMLQESVRLSKPNAVKVEIQKGSAFVPVAGSKVKKMEVTLSNHKKGTLKNIVIKQLPINATTESKPNLPLIRHPTKTLQVPKDFVKKLLCKEKLEEVGDKSGEVPKTMEVSANSKGIFISTKPVCPAAMQNGETQMPDKTSQPVVTTTSSSLLISDKCAIEEASALPSEVSTEKQDSVSSPNSPPFHPIPMEETKDQRAMSSQSENSQSSSLNIPLSPYLQLCKGSSRGMSPLLNRVSELERISGTDSQVSAQCRSKSVSPVGEKPKINAGKLPIGTSSPVMLLNNSVKPSSTYNATTIPNTCIQTCMITSARVTPTMATPVRFGLPMPITHVTTLIPGAPIPAVRQSSIGQFMPMSSVLPPHPASGHTPMPSTLCNRIHPCLSPVTYVPTTNNHMVSPTYTSTSTPAGLITPTSSAQCTSDINYYRTPTSLPLGTMQPKAFLNGQALGIPTPYVLSGLGGSIGQLQPVSRRLTLALPPGSQS